MVGWSVSGHRHSCASLADVNSLFYISGQPVTSTFGQSGSIFGSYYLPLFNQ